MKLKTNKYKETKYKQLKERPNGWSLDGPVTLNETLPWPQGELIPEHNILNNTSH